MSDDEDGLIAQWVWGILGAVMYGGLALILAWGVFDFLRSLVT